MKAQTIMVCVFIFLCSELKAQITFDTTYDYQMHGGFGYSVQVTDDSFYFCSTAGLIVSSNQDQPLLLYKIRYNKEFEALSIIQDSTRFFYTGLSGALIKCHDGGFATGATYVDTVLKRNTAMLVRYNQAPDTLFTRKYFQSSSDIFYNSIETSDHGFALVGISGTYDSVTQLYDDDYWLVKTDSAGNVQSQQTYGGMEDDDAIVISEISGKRLIFSGVKKLNLTNYTPWILVTDFTGNILKQKELNDPLYYHCGGSWIKPALDNAYLFLGYMDTVINNGDIPCPNYLAKMDTDFNFLWTVIFNDTLFKAIYNLRQLADSSIVFVGFTGFNTFGWIGKLDKNGNKLWEREFQHGNSGVNIFADFQQTPWDKGFILTGSTIDNYNQNLWLVKLDSNGMLLPDTVNNGTFEVSDEILEMELYPNPASNQTLVQYNIPSSEEEVELLISDMQGKILSTVKLSPQKHSLVLEVSDYAAGLYFITLRAGEDFITKKLIRQ